VPDNVGKRITIPVVTDLMFIFAALDARKAFESVNHVKRVNILLYKALPDRIIDVI